MRRAIAMLVWLTAALWVGPALAAGPSSPVALAAWVGSNTDLHASQVAIAGPDNVYSVEPLGPRLPTGEVLALVRTEALSADWRAAHQFQSWDAHLLFDCNGGRVRVLRSTSYAEHNRGGLAKPDERGQAWFSPEASDPAARLLAAACDAKFDWPLRGVAATPATDPAAPAAPSSPPDPQPALQVAKAAGGESPAIARDVAPVPASAVAKPQPAAAAVATVAAVDRRAETVAPVTLAQAMQPVVVEAPAALQKASFTALPIAPQALHAPQAAADEDRSRANVISTAATATKRLAGEVRSWLWRRVEVAWARRGEGRAPDAAAPAAPAHVTT